jgi:ferredoxin
VRTKRDFAQAAKHEHQEVDHHRWRARDSGRGTARRRGVRARIVGPESAVGIGARQLGRPDNSLVAVAANVLGMEQTALVAELNTGKTIADVATAKGVALDKIVTAFVQPHVDWLNVLSFLLIRRTADTCQSCALCERPCPVKPHQSKHPVPNSMTVSILFAVIEENLYKLLTFT